MTTAEIVAYYVNLLIMQFNGKAKASAEIAALVTPAVMDQLPISVREAFTLGTAVGQQLQWIGKYAGVTNSGFGLNGQPITLNDPDFTKLILMAIIKNHSDNSLASIQKLLNQNFPGEVFTFDYKNMRMSYMLDSGVGSTNLFQIFVTQGILPRPMGVQISSLVTYTPIATTPIFGMGTMRSNAPFIDLPNANVVGYGTMAAQVVGKMLKMSDLVH